MNDDVAYVSLVRQLGRPRNMRAIYYVGNRELGSGTGYFSLYAFSESQGCNGCNAFFHYAEQGPFNDVAPGRCTHRDVYRRLLSVDWGCFSELQIILGGTIPHTDHVFGRVIEFLSMVEPHHIIALRDGYLDEYVITLPARTGVAC